MYELWSLQVHLCLLSFYLSKQGPFPGFEAHFLAAARQAEAAQTQGLPLEFYASYDVDWWKPWNYFDQLSAVDTSLLKRCNETQFSSDVQMRATLAWTGDTGGIQIVNGKDTGRQK